jgi:hypothetical protein
MIHGEDSIELVRELERGLKDAGLDVGVDSQGTNIWIFIYPNKVDEILGELQQRHLNKDQKTKLESLLKMSAPQELYFVSAPDAETTYFGNELVNTLDSAGWKVVPHPPDLTDLLYQVEC